MWDTYVRRTLICCSFIIMTSAHARADDLFFKLAGTSYHWGEDIDYSFNKENFGIGLGYTVDGPGRWETSVSLATYRDSFYTQGWNLQARMVHPVWKERIRLGGSLNLAYKSLNPDEERTLFVAPTGAALIRLSEGIDLAIDVAPAIKNVNPVGFVALSLEFQF
jgi:hypothetical protein